MRLLPPFAIALLCVPLVSCGGGGGDPYATAKWQVRCPVDFAGCPGPGRAHEVQGVSGEGQFVRCTVEKRDDEGLRMSFAFRDNRPDIPNNELQVQANFVPGNPVSSCEVTASEGGNEYIAAGTKCGAGSPTDSQPCRVYDLKVMEDAEPRPRLDGKVLCRKFKDPSSPMRLQRDLTFPHDSDRPAEFQIDTCTGNGL